ncbi:MAG: LPS-assembly protein LptD [Chlorobi bacterium]|nr:LPS-assembly protein LptD [Chlorobiota bacterium]
MAFTLYPASENFSPNVWQKPDTLIATTTVTSDSLKPVITADVGRDSSGIALKDTLLDLNSTGDSLESKKSEASLDAVVERIAVDSIVQDIINRKVYMYGEAVINYQDITLKAAYIEIDFNTNEVYARGITDSTGKKTGLPEFTEGGQTFKAREMTYNFDTKKGIITKVITEDDAGFLHGQKVKKLDDNSINVFRGEYTTCNNEEHPHFAFKFKKAKVIPDSKIITGPAYMEIEGMPTPLGVPFGYFPNKMGRKSGILIPTYGESANRGFYLEDGGYYWGINEYMDLQVTGDIYSHGSWAVKPKLRYKKRYKFSGSFDAGYAINVVGTNGAPDFSKSTDFRIRWTHRQDPKARPRSTFTANVNIVSSNFIKYNVVNVNDYLSNEFQSSVAYQTNWAGKYFLTVNASHRQNTKTNAVEVNLPELTFAVNRFYPLKREGGKKRFYEDLSISYNMNAKNTISTVDSMLFSASTIKNNMQNGMIHKMPISLPVKVLKYFNLSTSFNFTDRMYSQSVRKYWSGDTLFRDKDTLVGYVKTDTVQGFRNSVDFSFSSTMTTKIYGMLKFKKGPLRAIRHVFTPSFGFSYTPDFGAANWGYYDTYADTLGNDVIYSQFDGSLYGSPPGQKSGRINFSFANNLEIKVRSRKDTVTGMKKIALIDNLTLSGSYDLAKDSMNMSFLTVQGRTRLWKNMNLLYSSKWDPYALNADGDRTADYEWDINKRILRFDNTSWNLSFNLKFGDKDFKKKKKKEDKNATEDEIDEINANPGNYVDWNIPWSLNLAYNFTYTNNLTYIDYIKQPEKTIVQTLSFNGQINITPKWKFTMRSGWDFTNNQLSYTSINLYRDLHCWEMRFSWIPIGARQSWNFSINVKASILQDLKLNKKKDFRDI